MGKPVVMGRKTYQSIGKPLAGRTNIVVSRDPRLRGRTAFSSPAVVDAALAAARADAQERGADEIVVIGGTDMFVQTCPLPTAWKLPMCTRSRRAIPTSRRSMRRSGARWRAATMPPGRKTKLLSAIVTYARA